MWQTDRHPESSIAVVCISRNLRKANTGCMWLLKEKCNTNSYSTTSWPQHCLWIKINLANATATHHRQNRTEQNLYWDWSIVFNLFTIYHKMISGFSSSYCSAYHENFSTHKLQPAIAEWQSHWLYAATLWCLQSTDKRRLWSAHDTKHVMYVSSRCSCHLTHLPWHWLLEAS